MGHRFVNRMKEGDTVSGVYQLTECVVRPNRNGNLYLHLIIADKTGQISGKYWNVPEELIGQFNDGDFAAVEGMIEKFNGALQFKVCHLEAVDSSRLNLSELLRDPPVCIADYLQKVRTLFGTITDPNLCNLADCFLSDTDFMTAFTSVPAGVSLHHNYPGGLLVHTTEMMELALAVGKIHSKELDPELLLMGTFLHDIGKTIELTTQNGLSYTDVGQLMGHIVLGIGILEKKIEEANNIAPFPQETAMLLKHMVVSHHGDRDKGSPAVPATVEAIALHFIDSLDSKVAEFYKDIRDDPNVGKSWTAKIPILDRRLYKKQANHPLNQQF